MIWMDKSHSRHLSRVFPGFAPRMRADMPDAGAATPRGVRRSGIAEPAAAGIGPRTHARVALQGPLEPFHRRPVCGPAQARSAGGAIDAADRAYAPMPVIEAYVDVVRRAQGKPTFAEIQPGACDFEAQMQDFADDVFKAMGADAR